VLARDAVEPAREAAGDVEIIGVDGQHAAVHQHAVVEPLGQRDPHAADAALGVDDLGEAVEPRERRFAAAHAVQVGAHGRRLQAGEGIGQVLYSPPPVSRRKTLSMS
jgi:hypothetical protein